MNQVVKIGTRGSDLALWQAHYLQESLTVNNIKSELVIVKTRGDKDLRPLKEIAGDGFFTKDLENLLLSGDIDIAIHSAKDLASMRHHCLPWRALGPRAETDDILIYKHEKNQSDFAFAGKTVGTSSPRRKAQILLNFPGAKPTELRGNVPTRLGKVLSGELDAVILAGAGLNRLKLLDSLPEQVRFKKLDWTTAPCQGILAVQGRVSTLERISAVLDDDLSQIALIEKSILAYLGGGCHMAVGVKLCKIDEGYELDFYLFENGDKAFTKRYRDLTQLNTEMFFDIQTCISEKPNMSAASPQVLLTNTLSTQRKIMEAAIDANYKARSLPMGEVSSSLDSSSFSSFVASLDKTTSLVFTSQYAVRIFFMEFFNQQRPKGDLSTCAIYCVGSSTRNKVLQFGFSSVELSWDSNSDALLEHLKAQGHTSLSFVGTSDANILKQGPKLGFKLSFLEVYRNEIPYWLKGTAPQFENYQAICFSSPSSVSRFVESFRLETLKSLKVFAIGPSTGRELTKLGINCSMDPSEASWSKIFSHESTKGVLNEN